MTILVQQQLRDLLGKLTTAFWRNDGALVCSAYRDGETVYVESWRPVAEAASTDYARFIAAANPAAVLALLDEIDRLTRAAKYCEEIDATHENQRETMLYDMAVERDQLKAENAELRLIVSKCATACGAAVSSECSLSFMAGLPREIELAMTKEQP